MQVGNTTQYKKWRNESKVRGVYAVRRRSLELQASFFGSVPRFNAL
jgi:hypothetical protein